MMTACKAFNLPLPPASCEAADASLDSSVCAPLRPALLRMEAAASAQADARPHLWQASAPSPDGFAAACPQPAATSVLPAKAEGIRGADRSAAAHATLGAHPLSQRAQRSFHLAAGRGDSTGAAATARGASLVHVLRKAAVLLAAACLCGALFAQAGHAAWPPSAGFEPEPVRLTLAYQGSDRVHPLFASADYTRPDDFLSGILASWKVVPATDEKCASQAQHNDMCLFAFSFNELSPMETFFSASQANSIKASYLFDAWKWLPHTDFAAGTMRLHTARISMSSVTVYSAHHRNNAKRLLDCEASEQGCTLNLAGESMRKLFAAAARATQPGGEPFLYVGIDHCTPSGDIRFDVSVSQDRHGSQAPASQRVHSDLGPTLKAVRGCTRLLPLEAIREALREDQQENTVPLPYFHVLPRP